MRATKLVVFIISLLITTGTTAADDSAELEIGSFVVLEIEGELATKYSQASDVTLSKNAVGDLCTNQLAIVTWISEDGLLTIKHSNDLFALRAPSKLVTIVTTVSKDQLTPVLTKVGTLVHSHERLHRVDAVAKPLQADRTSYHLLRRNMQNVEITTWDRSNSLR